MIQIAWFHWRGNVSAVNWLSADHRRLRRRPRSSCATKTFIKWKPTVLYLAFGGILAAGKLAWRRDLLAVVMKEITLPASIWTRLTWAWVGFFAAMAGANWYIAFHFSTDTWVNFKVWGGIGLFLVFALAQGLFLARHVIEPSA